MKPIQHYIDTLKAINPKAYFRHIVSAVKEPTQFFKLDYRRYSLEQTLLVYAVLSVCVLLSTVIILGFGFFSQLVTLSVAPFLGALFYRVIGNGFGKNDHSYHDALHIYTSMMNVVWPLYFIAGLIGLNMMSVLIGAICLGLAFYLSFYAFHIYYGIKKGVVIGILVVPAILSGCSAGIAVVGTVMSKKIVDIAEEYKNDTRASVGSESDSVSALENKRSSSDPVTSTLDKLVANDSEETEELDSDKIDRLNLVKLGESYTYRIIHREQTDPDAEVNGSLKFVVKEIEGRRVLTTVSWNDLYGDSGSADIYIAFNLADQIDESMRSDTGSINNSKVQDLVQEITSFQFGIIDGFMQLAQEVAKISNLANLLSSDKQVDRKQETVTIAGRKGVKQNLMMKNGSEGIVRTVDKSLSFPVLYQESRDKNGIKTFELVSYKAP